MKVTPIGKPALNEQGVYMVFLAFCAVALITLMAVVIVSAFLSINATRATNAANLAALGALEEFVRLETEPPQGCLEVTYWQRASAALNKGTNIISAQRLVGGGRLGELGFAGNPGAGGVMRFGRFYPYNDGSGSCENYPCFVEVAQPVMGSCDLPPPPGVNAVKIEALMVEPFMGVLGFFLGRDRFTVRAEATSAVKERCTVMLLDVSGSAVTQTHIDNESRLERNGDCSYWYDPGAGSTGSCRIPSSGPAWKYACPRNAALFAYDKNTLYRRVGTWPVYYEYVDPDNNGVMSTENEGPCAGEFTNNTIYAVTNIQGRLWCHISHVNGAFNNMGSGADPSLHYPTDYQHVNTRYGNVLADARTKPQPLSSFLLAFNSGARLLMSQSSLADKAALLVFKGTVFDRVPPTPSQGFTTDLGYIVQLTNVNNVTMPGTTPTYPNYVSVGWFPRAKEDHDGGTGFTTAGGSNIVQAIRDAISLLGDPSKCPVSAQKSIILASDGIAQCRLNDPLNQPSSWSCADEYANFEFCRDFLLEDDPTTIKAGDSILRQLQEGKIAFTVLLAGKGIGAHVLNRKVGGKWLDYYEAQARGFGGQPLLGDPSLNPLLFVDSRPQAPCSPCTCGGGCEGGTAVECPANEYAFKYFWKSDTAFREPNGVFAELAMKSPGGVFCPLLPRGESEWYEDTPPRKLKDEYRETIGEGNPIPYALEYLSEGEQAAKCVRNTLGLNPFVLVTAE